MRRLPTLAALALAFRGASECAVYALQIGARQRLALRSLASAKVSPRAVAKRPSSTSPLFNDLTAVDNGAVANGSDAPHTSIVPHIAPWVRALLLFGVGYGLGTASAPGWQRHARVSQKIGVARILLAVLIVRDAWRSTPQWAKPRIARYGRRMVNIVRAPFRGSGAVTENEDAVAEDLDDITDMSNFATKLQGVMNVAKTKLELEEEDENEPTDFNVQPFLALIQLLSQVKSRRAKSRDQIYQSSGTTVPNELLEGMDERFELADLAYDEHESGDDLKTVLGRMGKSLLKHDTTAVPGYLGHYIAIDSDPSKKEAIIGVKGTSNMEDFLTDMCAASVEYNLTDAFYDGGRATLRCHEGVFISSQRLAKELLPFIQNLLLPAGYKITVAGHSLGAGCATLLAVLLRTAIPSLQDPYRLSVWAFASPPVLDYNSALACSPFVTTVVNNCDVVPRASIGPLVVTGRMLRVVDQKLTEKNLDMSDFRSTMAFLDKMWEGNDGEMLMSADEVGSELEKALDGVELEDPDHLYVPGKVVLMYDLWEKEQREGQDGKEERKGSALSTARNWMQQVKNDVHSNDASKDDIPMAEEAVLCDGACKALRFVELQGCSTITWPQITGPVLQMYLREAESPPKQSRTRVEMELKVRDCFLLCRNLLCKCRASLAISQSEAEGPN